MGISNFKMSGLSEIIREKLYIPKYQRSYAWEKDEYTDLWDDLSFLVADGSEMHFYGQIVVHQNKEDGCKYIIDGQQRITTSFFLIRAFLNGYNNIYSKYKDQTSKEAKKLNRQIIEIEQLIGYDSTENSSNQALKLIQNEIDNDYFVRLICWDTDAIKEKNPPKSSKTLMKSALTFFDSKIKGILKDINEIDDKLELLNKYYRSFTEKFKVMYLEDDNLSEAYTIFETLNDRGKDLVSTDLLKNYILANSANVDLSYKKWNKIIVNLDTLDITKFIRHVWNAEHDFTRERVLYTNITSELQRSGVKCDRFLDELSEASYFYHDMFEPNDVKIINDAQFIDCMKALKIMKSITWCPTLIAMYNKRDANNNRVFEQKDITKVALAIETFVFKNFVICGTNPNEAEVKFAQLGKRISENISNCDDIVKTIKSWIVTDIIFESSFKEHSFNDSESDKEKIRYIFRKMHKYLDKTKEININNSEVHIEHIMPQDIAQWPEITDDVHELYLWKLGNLCLLGGPLNQEISNKPFSFKKTNAYNVSEIKPNKDLLKYSKWDKDSIESRQMELLELVKKIWN